MLLLALTRSGVTVTVDLALLVLLFFVLLLVILPKPKLVSTAPAPSLFRYACGLPPSSEDQVEAVRLGAAQVGSNALTGVRSPRAYIRTHMHAHARTHTHAAHTSPPA